MAGPEPFLQIDGTEVINANRTLTYLRRGLSNTNLIVGIRSPFLSEGPGYEDVYKDTYKIDEFSAFNLACYCHAFDDKLYLSPKDDPAPWFEPTRPESAEFLGIVPTNIEFSEVFDRNVSEKSPFGGSVGRLKIVQRTVAVEGRMFASSRPGMQWGERWLTRVFSKIGSPGSCGLQTAIFLPACPTIPAGVTTTLVPINDSWVSTVPGCVLEDNNHNTQDLEVSGVTDNTKDSYIQFNLASIPSDAVLTSAKLILRVKTAPTLSQSVGIWKIKDADEDWSETTIKCSNRPPVDGLLALQTFNTGTTSGVDIEIDLNLDVLKRLEDRLGQKVTLVLRNEALSVLTTVFEDRESGSIGPRLQISYQPKTDNNPFFRHLTLAGIIDGPVFRPIEDLQVCEMQDVSFQLVAGNPYFLAPPVTIVPFTYLAIPKQLYKPICSETIKADQGMEAGVRITLHGGSAGDAIKGPVTIHATPVISNERDPIIYQVHFLEPGTKLVIDSSQRTVSIEPYDPHKTPSKSGLDVITWDGIFRWIELQPGDEWTIDVFTEATNLVTNPGFEDGVLTPWSSRDEGTYQKVDVVQKDPFEGKYHVQIRVLATGGTGDLYNYAVFQRVDPGPEPNGSYTLSAYIKAKAGKLIGIRAIRSVDGFFRWGGGSTADVATTVAATGDWQRLAVTMSPWTLTGNTDKIEIRIGFNDSRLAVEDTCFVDAAMLTNNELVCAYHAPFPIVVGDEGIDVVMPTKSLNESTAITIERIDREI